MDKYQTITREEAFELSPSQFRKMYTDAVETIWHLQRELAELHSENNSLWEAYEKVADQLFGL